MESSQFVNVQSPWCQHIIDEQLTKITTFTLSKSLLKTMTKIADVFFINNKRHRQPYIPPPPPHGTSCYIPPTICGGGTVNNMASTFTNLMMVTYFSADVSKKQSLHGCLILKQHCQQKRNQREWEYIPFHTNGNYLE